MKPQDFLIGPIEYDNEGSYLFANSDRFHMIADIRGWAKIQKLFTNADGTVDFEKAAAFQDEVGQFIADAINEKLSKQQGGK